LVLTMASPNPREDRGAVAILAVAVCSVLFGLAALVVDLGIARSQRARAQTAADAGALAAADLLNRDPTAVLSQVANVALQYVDENLSEPMDRGGCAGLAVLPVVAPGTDCVSFDAATAPTTVRVYAVPAAQPAMFGALFGADSYHVAAKADARIPVPISEACDPCVLPDGGPSAATLSAPVLPDLSSLTFHGNITGCPTLPGVYGDVSVGDTPCVLPSGTYVITGTLRIGAGRELRSEFTTIILGCADSGGPARPCGMGEAGGAIEGDPASTVTLVGNSGLVPGFAVVSDPENVASSRLVREWSIDGLYVRQGEWVSPPPEPGLVQ
jgi:Putative Flp pilus-assembly TadE/G-like